MAIAHRLFFITLALLAAPVSAYAEDAEILSRMPHYHTTIVAQEDYSFTYKNDWSTKVIDERALEDNKRTSVSYSTSIEDIDIHHAYTLKADGRRIDAPENNYQYRKNTGSGGNVPAFSDRSRVTVIFPELEVGDTVYFAYTIHNKEPMFPGYFTANSLYSKDYAYDDVVVVLDVPRSFPGKYQVRDMQETIKKHGDRVKYTWKFSNPEPQKSERTNFSVWKREDFPGYEYSTFKSYQAIAEAYGKRAKPKAAVTPKIEQLAASIVGDETDKRERARLLYNWVATQISYAGNCIGVGAVVPRDLDFVIDNRMGDCKDHATLLEALLTSQGIKSTQALINSGAVFYLPKVPMVSSVNHVINYLPEFDLYVDATSSKMPFGLLSMSIADKPVLHVDKFKKGLRTPADKPQNNVQTMTSKITIADNGSASISLEIDIKGRAAAYSRASFREIKTQDLEKIVDNVIRGMGHIGSGTFENADPSALVDEFSYKLDLELERYINRPGAGAFGISPYAFSQLGVYQFVDSANAEPVTSEIQCSNGLSTERYEITLPPTMKLLAKPQGMKIHEKDLYYRSEYTWKDNVLTVVRELRDETPGNRCKPDYVNAQMEVARKIMDDLRQQVVYQ